MSIRTSIPALLIIFVSMLRPVAVQAQEKIVLTNVPTYEFTAPYTNRPVKIDVDYTSSVDEPVEVNLLVELLDLSTHKPVEGSWIQPPSVQHGEVIVHHWSTMRPLVPNHRYQVEMIGAVIETTYTVRITRMP